jgi:hypothetical protein
MRLIMGSSGGDEREPGSMSERRFFLRPSALTNAIFLYVLAVAARPHRVEVHAFCVLSNQYDRTDVRRRPGAFGRVAEPLWPVAGAREAVEVRRRHES